MSLIIELFMELAILIVLQRLTNKAVKEKNIPFAVIGWTATVVVVVFLTMNILNIV